MARLTVLRTRLDGVTAARVRLQAERSGMSMSGWIGSVVRRELGRAGAADALAEKSYEVGLTVGYMLRALMVEALGAEATERAVAQATGAAAEEAAAEAARGRGLGG